VSVFECPKRDEPTAFRPLQQRFRFFLSLLCVIALAGCAHRKSTVRQPGQTPLPSPSGTPPAIERQPPAVPGQYVQQGVASWYGKPFNGHRTSDGEVYDMYQFTAAHRTLPFGSIVRVTNLLNGKQIDVRINDRGPFVADRIIDLSLSAARAIEMIGTGTAPVRLDVVSGPNPSVGFFGIQVGAFLVQENAQRLRDGLAAKYSPVTIVPYDSPSGLYYRVRVGRLTTEAAARDFAAQLAADGERTTFVVRLDNEQ
jgi:rare lipoprotein A